MWPRANAAALSRLGMNVLVRRAVRGEANAFGRNSMRTHSSSRDKTQGQLPRRTALVDEVLLNRKHNHGLIFHDRIRDLISCDAARLIARERICVLL
jgi:hypothetical protein